MSPISPIDHMVARYEPWEFALLRTGRITARSVSATLLELTRKGAIHIEGRIVSPTGTSDGLTPTELRILATITARSGLRPDVVLEILEDEARRGGWSPRGGYTNWIERSHAWNEIRMWMRWQAPAAVSGDRRSALGLSPTVVMAEVLRLTDDLERSLSFGHACGLSFGEGSIETAHREMGRAPSAQVRRALWLYNRLDFTARTWAATRFARRLVRHSDQPGSRRYPITVVVLGLVALVGLIMVAGEGPDPAPARTTTTTIEALR